MADPLSVAGLALAVVSLGLQVTGGITEYFDALNSRDQDVESARQQNDTLRKILQVVETSISRLQRDHSAATEALRECLDSCKKELQVLEGIVAKLQNQGNKLLYPFSRPKLQQIATKLDHINTNLQLALQTLGLSVSQLGTEKLATLEAASHTISTDLLSVQSEVSAIGTPLQGIHNTLSKYETRFDGLENLIRQLVQDLSITETSPEVTPSIVAGRLLRRPQVLQDVYEAVGDRARPRSSEALSTMHHDATKISSTMSTYTGGRFSCICRRRRRPQRKNVAWGSLSLSFETATEQHVPGCPAARIVVYTDRSRKISLTYGGVRCLFNLAIRLSFMVRWAGAWSLGTNFTYYPVVDSESAPAFRMLSLITRSRISMSNEGRMDKVIWRETLISSVVSAILRLFQAKKASPRAVDAGNRSLVYELAECISCNIEELQQLPSQTEPSPLLDLLEYLLFNKAPANDYDTSGDTPLSRMFTSTTYHRANDPLPGAAAELILRSNTEDNVAYLLGPNLPVYPRCFGPLERHNYAVDTVVLLDFLACSTKIAEAYGCGPLGIAILSDNLKEVEHLVKNHPATLAERDLFGHTPLHLAADRPSCLRLLVEAADAKLLNQTDRPDVFGQSAFETAVFVSGWHCREYHRMCDGQCGCDECAVILLEAGCALPVPATLGVMFSFASERCKLTYVCGMKDRRNRLKKLTLDNLPAMEVERFGLASERILDSHASEVIQLLQDSGVRVPVALTVLRNKPLTVYQALSSPDDGEPFFQVGFRDTESWCNADMVELLVAPNRVRGLPWLHWLTMHGGISCQPSSASARDIYTAHLTFWSLGWDLKNHWRNKYLTGRSGPPQVPPLEDRMAWIRELHTSALTANITDACRCQCSPGGCTPLTSLLKGVLHNSYFAYKSGPSPENSVTEDTDDLENSTTDSTGSTEDSFTEERSLLLQLITAFIVYLERFWSQLEVRHHIAALRYITYTALGIRHSCCYPYYFSHLYEDDSSVDENEDEKYRFVLLEEVLRGFEGELIPILEDPDIGIANVTGFWKRTWVGRMHEILDHLEGRNLTDEERRGAEEIGVVWDKMGPEPPEVTGNPYPSSTLDHWMYELTKIETGVQ